MSTSETQDWAPHDTSPVSSSQQTLPNPTVPLNTLPKKSTIHRSTGWQIPLHADRSTPDLRISRGTLEKIYLNPPTDVKGDNRNIFANPTPLGLVGFLVATMPVALQLMGLHASAPGGGGGTATVYVQFIF
jgi:hypothetical protein